MTTNKPVDIDAYVAEFPEEVQAVLEQVRSTIQKTAPAAEEAIGYGMPAFSLMGKFWFTLLPSKTMLVFMHCPRAMRDLKKNCLCIKSGRGRFSFH